MTNQKPIHLTESHLNSEYFNQYGSYIRSQVGYEFSGFVPIAGIDSAEPLQEIEKHSQNKSL